MEWFLTVKSVLLVVLAYWLITGLLSNSESVFGWLGKVLHYLFYWPLAFLAEACLVAVWWTGTTTLLRFLLATVIIVLISLVTCHGWPGDYEEENF